MWCDVTECHRFYLSKSGMMAQRAISRRLHDMWPDVHGLVLGAYGYPLPYLDTFSQETVRTMVCMPGPMGATPWPVLDHNRVVLCPEGDLPFLPESLDRLLLTHALEFTENTRLLLRSCWQSLKPEGEIIIVAPNRRGLWCQRPDQPFGCGHPYTARQLFTLLCDHLFSPEKPLYGLFHPPLEKTFSYRTSIAFEKYGALWFKKLGGVVIIKAKKNILGGISHPAPFWKARIFVPKQWETIRKTPRTQPPKQKRPTP